MALKGNLRDFSTTQLLHLINLARKTGTLTIEGGEQAVMSFRQGKLIYAQTNGQSTGDLAAVLQRSGKISTEQAQFINKRAQGTSEKQLGHLLIQAGYVTQSDIIQSVRQHVLGVVYKLFTWADGTFRFDANAMPSKDRITIPIDLESVIMEGSRRLKEWEKLQEVLPDLNTSMRFAEKPDSRLRNINLTVQEWRVVSFINPKNSLQQIARANDLSDIEIRRIIYGLMQAGIVEFNQPKMSSAPAPKPKPAVEKGANAPIRKAPGLQMETAKKRSIVGRLIGRIRGL